MCSTVECFALPFAVLPAGMHRGWELDCTSRRLRSERRRITRVAWGKARPTGEIRQIIGIGYTRTHDVADTHVITNLLHAEDDSPIFVLATRIRVGDTILSYNPAIVLGTPVQRLRGASRHGYGGQQGERQRG